MRPLLYLVAGARPNFMKIAPLIRALASAKRFEWRLVHTGQHYDSNMSDVFFAELGIPTPDFHFNATAGTHAEQTAQIMVAFEKLCAQRRPDAVIVVGDVNSTMACAIAGKKFGIPVAHTEAGLRSGDLSMPEEINRIVTDSISDWFFVTEPSGVANLRREGKEASRIHHVGNLMVDNVLQQAAKLRKTRSSPLESDETKRRVGPHYGVVTLHRPSNVDDPSVLGNAVQLLNRIAEQLPLVFPVHPRTRKRLDLLSLKFCAQVHLLPPQGYMSFLNLWMDAAVVLTDSGGLQEETTALGVPCVTVRDSTERPITIEMGSNTLAGTNPDDVMDAVHRVLAKTRSREFRRPVLWDGRSAERIEQILAREILRPLP